MADDPVMARITAAIGQLQVGDRDGARFEFEAIWREISASPNPLHECTLAHFMADLQSDIASELSWDLRALTAALRATDAEFQHYEASLSARAFLPSLYLNLADDYRRLGDIEVARRYLTLGQGSLDGQPASPYFGTIRAALDRLADKMRHTGLHTHPVEAGITPP